MVPYVCRIWGFCSSGYEDSCLLVYVVCWSCASAWYLLHIGFLLGLFFDDEDRGNIVLWNMVLIFTGLYSIISQKIGLFVWYIILFRRLISAIVLNLFVICLKNVGMKIDHLNFLCVLLMGYWLSVLGHHGHDNTMKRLTERCFPRIPSHRKGAQANKIVFSLQQSWQKKRDCIILSWLWCYSVCRQVFEACHTKHF
jgi:hypothetical protein